MNIDILNSTENGHRRKLISFAYLAQATKDEDDLIGGISSIFKPIAKQYAGKLFEANTFCEIVNDLYGLKILPWAAEDLTVRLEKNGILIRQDVTEGVVQYRYSDYEADYSSVEEKDIAFVVESFVQFCKPKLIQHNIELDVVTLGDKFLDHLVDLNFIQTALQPGVLQDDKNFDESTVEKNAQWKDEFRDASRINSLCAGFVVEAYHRNRSLYDLILKIVSGALVSEVVLNFQEPAVNADLKQVNLILDTPFLMAFLDLSCEKERDFSIEICDQVVNKGGTLCVYEHSVEELVDNLKGVKGRFENGVSFGATGRRLRNSAFKAYLSEVLKDPISILRKRKIKILKNISSENAFKIFPEKDEDYLRNSFGDYSNRLAQERDARSIALTMRFRNGNRTRLKEFYKCNYIFLTENSFIPNKSMDYMIRKNFLSQVDVPPAVSGRYIAGLIWVLFGGKGKDMSRQLLLANCSAALEPKADIIAKVNSFLVGMSQSQADLFDALMGDERAGQYLMQNSLGDATLINRDNIDKILEELKNSLIEKNRIESEKAINEHRENSNREIEELEVKYEKALEERNKEKDEILEDLLIRGQDLISQEKLNEKLNLELEELRRKVEIEKHKQKAELAGRIKLCMHKANKKRNALTHLVSGIIAVAFWGITFTGCLYGSNILIALLVASLTSLLTWYGLENEKIPFVKKYYENYREEKLSAFLIEKDIDRDLIEHINWIEMDVAIK